MDNARTATYLEAAITAHWGRRCPIPSALCPTCSAWAEYDELVRRSGPPHRDAAAEDHVDRATVGATIGDTVTEFTEQLRARVQAHVDQMAADAVSSRMVTDKPRPASDV